MSPNKVEELIKKYLAGNCTEIEQALVESWHLQDIEERENFISNKKIEEVNKRMRERLMLHAKSEVVDGYLDIEGESDIDAGVRKHSTFLIWPKLAAAGIILISLAFGAYFYHTQYGSTNSSKTAYVKDILAVKNKATLTLADGRSIDLNEDQNGIVVGAEKVKYANGTNVLDNAPAQSLLTLSTPKGAQYQIVLPDGTKIWLNGKSSIRYPLAFEKKRRSIEVLNGEVYLEVVHNSLAPFHVSVKGQDIEVLGTSFNINAYSVGKTVTSLVSGSVKVKNKQGDSHLVLVPGEESVLEENRLIKRQADLTKVTAWKDNYFYFKNEPIENVMNQISQWYGVSIKYNDSFDKIRIGGFISRNNSLKTLLGLLEETGNFSLELQDSTVVVKHRN